MLSSNNYLAFLYCLKRPKMVYTAGTSFLGSHIFPAMIRIVNSQHASRRLFLQEEPVLSRD